MEARAAVIQFPGVNCEFETVRALREAGLEAEIAPWNRTEDLLDRYGGFVLPGGFSYQDRVRGGVIASREPVMDVMAEAAARGMPVLGICNGAQILVESGLVPGMKPDAVEAALAPNRIPHRTGYHCAWVHVAHTGKGSFLGRVLGDGETIPLPVAHGEGRFVSKDPGLFPALLEAGQVVLRYASPGGETAEEFPLCPNGSTFAAAAISNREGNVVAMMPHPERALHLHHVPDDLPGPWGERKGAAAGPEDLFAPGPGRAVIDAFAAAVKEGGRP
ncbi:MAG: phosphoribosylformylglycinamidine synthase I [Candidatus Eisenbacteria bacterium]